MLGVIADANAQSATDAYVAMRDRYIALDADRYKAIVSQSRAVEKEKGYTASEAFWGKQSAGNWQKEQGRQLRELESKLRGLIGVIRINGVPTLGTANVDTLMPELGFGKLDGLRFELNADEFMVVTTRSLFSHWLRSAAHWFPGADFIIPADSPGALHSTWVWTTAIEVDVRVIGFGGVPVAVPRGSSDATVILGLVSSDRDFMYLPDTIFASVSFGDRIYLFSKKIESGLQHIKVCDELWQNLDKKAQAQLHKTQVLPPGQAKERGFTTSEAMEDSTDAAYERCFAANLGNQSKFADLVAEAQALVYGVGERGLTTIGANGKVAR
jgi:hypothetical protein